MEVPQTKRHPLPPDPGERDQLLRLPHAEDAIDPFVTDPNPVIKEKGMLALRVRNSQADCYFELGDLCAKLIRGRDDRLRIFYVGKALIAYQRAQECAGNDVDRVMGKRAIDMLGDWLVEFARSYPTQLNIAVALWA